MKLLISVVLLGMCSVASATPEQVFNKIIKANNISTPIRFVINSTSKVNASCNHGVLTLNRGMIAFARSESELAVVIGHEISHCLNRDVTSRPALEYRADKQGAYLAGTAGYDVCSGVSIIKRFNDPVTKTHPASIDRYNKVKC